MSYTKRISLFILYFFFGWVVTGDSAQAIEWQNLTPYQRQLVTFVLPESSPQVWEQSKSQDFLEEYGTRSSTYHAVGMLFRNEGADRENAQLVIRGVLELQHNIPGEKLHGVWRTDVKKDKRDDNWREFVGTGLIVIREYFGDVIEPDLIRDLDASLVRAAEGAAERDVSPEYTNIALMSAFLLDYTGHIASNQSFQEKGKAKAKAILDLFSRHHTFTEFNSPTYYGANLMALGLWRELGRSPELREWAKTMESIFWAEISQSYHAGLKNMCGPYIRSYGMDMTRYNALVGMCISMGLDDPKHAPLPSSKDRSFEWAYAPLFALLKIQPPEELLPEFKTFGEPREVRHQIPNRKGGNQAQSLLESDWMMGAATGMRRRWDQHYPGTVHWSAGPDSELGWLLVYGRNAAEAKIEDRKLQIFLPKPDDDHPLRILVQVPGMQRKQIGKDKWSLPGMSFDIQTPLDPPTVKIKDVKYLGQVIEIAFPLSNSLSADEPALVLTPRKTR